MPFEYDQDVTQAQIDRFLIGKEDTSAIDGIELDEEKCKALCKDIIANGRQSFVDAVDSCTYTLADTLAVDDTGVNPGDVVVGHLVCEGIESEYCVGGRRPLCHRPARLAGGKALGVQLAAMAHMETVSVTAFRELAEQLHAHGAPKVLIERCLAAATDEVLHARLLSILAKHYGGSFEAEAAGCDVGANLRDIAIHNAVEGCVNEAWAACLAVHQARAATDPAIRRVFARIARDEIRHAQLAWDLHEWVLTQLSESDVRAVMTAQRQAISALKEQDFIVDNEVEATLGFPDAQAAGRLKAAFANGLAA